MWRVIKKMYEVSRGAVLLEGEKSTTFSLEQGVAQGCSLSPILFSVFIDDLLREVEKADLGIQLGGGKKVGGMLFADDFVGVSGSKEGLQKLINVVHGYCNKWRLKANVRKSAVMVFSRNPVEGEWKWGEHALPRVSNYTYLGIDFACNGAWDMHIQKIRDNCKKKVNQLHSVISNRDINLTARRLLLLSVVRPSLEYGSEIWDCNKSQARALESIILGGAKKILGCSSKTCNEAVWGDMGLETLKSRRNRAKLKWWYKVCRLPDNRYPKQLLSHEWEIKPRKGRQRKTWSRTIDDIFHSLSLDKGELLDDMHEGNSSLKSFMACIEDDLREREAEEFRKGLDSKVKLDLYRRFGGKREFKKYLRGRSDEGARLLFKFRSGTHGLNEELGRHSDRDGRVECTLCGAECESVVHVLWECSSYSTCRDNFQEALKQLLGARYAEFETLSAVEKTSYVLGSENWEDDFDALLHLVKEFIVAVWEVRKQNLYGDDSHPGQFQHQSSAGDRGPVAGVGGRVGKSGKSGVSHGKGEGHVVHAGVNCVCNVCGSARSCGCVVNGSFARAAF